MSIAMASGLSALMGVNAELKDLQTQALSGKKINEASDGLAAYLSAQSYTNRANLISSVNDSLTGHASTLKAAGAGLKTLAKTLNDTRDLMNTAYASTQAVTGVSTTDTVADGVTKATTKITQRLSTTGATQYVNASTALIISGRTTTIGSEQMTKGNVYSLTVDIGGGTTKTLFFRISDASSTADPTGTYTADTAAAARLTSGWTSSAVSSGSSWVGDSSSTPLFVRTFGDIQTAFNNVSAASAGTAGNVSAVTTLSGTTTAAPTVGTAFNINTTLVNNAGTNSGSLAITNIAYAAGVTSGGVSNMLTGIRAYVPNTTHYYDKVVTAGASGTGQSATIFGQSDTYTPATATTQPSASRAIAATAFANALIAMDSYLNDASVSGVNLLTGDKLSIVYNEKGTSDTYQLKKANGTDPQSYGSIGLGFVALGATTSADVVNKFATNDDGATTGLAAAKAKVEAALLVVQSGQAQVGQFQATLSNRQDFNKSIMDLLNDTTNQLTAADMTEVATRTSALQVQQSFAQAILASTKQSDQSILQMFR
jgi:flagellin-like hook-associated protein FlgL